jgi:hypothetical protein
LDRFRPPRLFLPHNRDSSTGVAADQDGSIRRSVKGTSTRHGRQGVALDSPYQGNVATGVEDLHGTGFLHAAHSKDVQRRMPNSHKGGQPTTRQVIVAKTFSRFAVRAAGPFQIGKNVQFVRHGGRHGVGSGRRKKGGIDRFATVVRCHR